MTRSLSFSSWGKGELSPINRGHIDIEQYYASAESLENMLVRPYAVPVRRAGTKYVAPVKDSTKDTRLIEFVFSVDQSYIIEMGEYYFRFLTADGWVTIDGSTISVWNDGSAYERGDYVKTVDVGSWVETDYVEGDFAENDGSYYVCYRPNTGSAINEPGVGTGWTDFWVLSIETSAGAYSCLQDNTSDETNTPSTSGGATYWSRVLESPTGSDQWVYEIASPYTEAQIWDVDYAQKDDVIKMTHQLHDIGELRRISENSWTFVQGVIAGPPWQDLNEDPEITINPNAKLVGANYIVASDPIFTADDVGRYFRIGEFNTAGDQGYFLADTFTSTTRLDGDNIVELFSGDTTTKWARNAFFEDNYPAHVTYYEDRLVLANSPSDSQKIWLSKSNIYNDFNVTDDDAGGFDMVLNTEQSNDIKWLSSGESLASGTFGAEFTSRSPSDGALNNTNKNARRQSGWGGKFVRPKKIGNRVYFVQRTGRKLREYFYMWDNDNYSAQDMTKYSDHITISGIVDMDYQRNQDSLLWCVLGNGKMAIMSRHPDEEVQAWTPFITDGEVKSIRFIPNPDGESDRGFIIVERTISGSVTKNIEYFDNHVIEDDTRQDDLYNVDSGLVFNRYDKSIGNDLISITYAPDGGDERATITATSAYFNSDFATEGRLFRVISEEEQVMLEVTLDTFTSSTVMEGIVSFVNIVSVPSAVTGGLWAVSGDQTDTFGFSHIESDTESIQLFADGIYLGLGKVSSLFLGYYAYLDSLVNYSWWKFSAGLPYTSTLQTNPLNAQTPTGMAKGHIRGINGLSVELYRSLEMEYSSDGTGWFPVGVPEGTDTTVLFTGTVPNITFDGGKNYEGYIYLRQTKPYPMNVLGIYPDLKIN